jgi:hypothetical protein
MTILNSSARAAAAGVLVAIVGLAGALSASASSPRARAAGSTPVSCKASAKRMHSGRVLVDYKCTGIMVEQMKITSNRKITYAKAKEEITTCKRRSARVVVCVESGVTSEVTEPSAAIIGVKGRLCPARGRLKLHMVLTGSNETEFDEEAKAEPAVKGPC